MKTTPFPAGIGYLTFANEVQANDFDFPGNADALAAANAEMLGT